MSRLPKIEDSSPLPLADCPRVSIIFAARDEAEKLSGALATLLAQDDTNYEVVAVDDRSRDATGQILDAAAARDTRLKVIHVAELPPRWLGKPHALQAGYEHSTGEWLVFTDADVHFAPDLLRRALGLAQQRGLDHLTLLGSLDMNGFWEKTITLYFGVGFLFGLEIWKANDPRSSRYMGAGYFQLIRRSAYEAVGTHERLRMEVVDDMRLGKIVKVGGFRSGVALGTKHIRLRWNPSALELVRGVTKNFFAATGFSVSRVLIDVAGILALSVFPFVALALTTGSALIAAGAAAGVVLFAHGCIAYGSGESWAYAFTHPIGALIFSYMLLRSTAVTLWRGGIVWRDTFYPLDELKRGMV
jgi:glycosyltransferase involved in cell wall biosynthesis